MNASYILDEKETNFEKVYEIFENLYKKSVFNQKSRLLLCYSNPALFKKAQKSLQELETQCQSPFSGSIKTEAKITSVEKIYDVLTKALKKKEKFSLSTTCKLHNFPLDSEAYHTFRVHVEPSTERYEISCSYMNHPHIEDRVAYFTKILKDTEIPYTVSVIDDKMVILAGNDPVRSSSSDPLGTTNFQYPAKNLKELEKIIDVFFKKLIENVQNIYLSTNAKMTSEFLQLIGEYNPRVNASFRLNTSCTKKNIHDILCSADWGDYSLEIIELQDVPTKDMIELNISKKEDGTFQLSIFSRTATFKNTSETEKLLTQASKHKFKFKSAW